MKLKIKKPIKWGNDKIRKLIYDSLAGVKLLDYENYIHITEQGDIFMTFYRGRKAINISKEDEVDINKRLFTLKLITWDQI